MKLLADYHIHSKNSRFLHGKNKIEEIVMAANSIGLKEIAITDHGFRHFFRTSKEKLIKAREIIDDINTWSSTKVLLGIEADIISEDGTIDVDNETLTLLDILIVGYHKMIKTDFAGYFGNMRKSKRAIERCTNAYLNAIEKYPITIISHLDSILTTDLYKIGCACKAKNVMIEINNRHTNWNDAQMKQLLDSGCMFVVSSDAHTREDIGNVNRAMELVKKYQIPEVNIVNVEFDYDEKSEKDKEFDAFYKLYKQQMEIRNIKNTAIDDDSSEETIKLSNEMEDALRQIAEEKGISYNGQNDNNDEDVDGFINDLISYEQRALMKQAQQYIDEYEINHQNDQIEADASEFNVNLDEGVNVEEEIVVENDEISEVQEPEIVNEENHEVDDELKEEIVELTENEELSENVEQNEVENEETQQQPVEEQVDQVTEQGAVEEVQPEPVVEVVEEKPEVEAVVENVQEPVTVELDETSNFESVEEVVSKSAKEEKPEPEKVVSKRPRRMGGFMSETNGFVGLAEKNKK